jgi:hypothetical protein
MTYVLIDKKERFQSLSMFIDKLPKENPKLYFGIKLNYEKNIDNSEEVFVQNLLNISTTNKFKQLTSTLNSVNSNLIKFIVLFVSLCFC